MDKMHVCFSKERYFDKKSEPLKKAASIFMKPLYIVT
jgi:hypothetical protein